MTPSNADRYAEVHEATDDRIQCPGCQSMANARRVVTDGDMIIGMMVYCTNCGRSINTVYTREWMRLVREEEEQAERDRKAIDEDYRRQSARRLATGGYY